MRFPRPAGSCEIGAECFPSGACLCASCGFRTVIRTGNESSKCSVGGKKKTQQQYLSRCKWQERPFLRLMECSTLGSLVRSEACRFLDCLCRCHYHIRTPWRESSVELCGTYNIWLHHLSATGPLSHLHLH